MCIKWRSPEKKRGWDCSDGGEGDRGNPTERESSHWGGGENSYSRGEIVDAVRKGTVKRRILMGCKERGIVCRVRFPFWNTFNYENSRLSGSMGSSLKGGGLTERRE